jgi:hypothetical protein
MPLIAAVVGLVCTVIVKLAGDEPSVIVDGENVAVAPGGRPVAVSVTGKVNDPLTGATVKLKTAALPGITVWLALPLPVVVSVKLKSPTCSTMAAEVLPVKLASPLYTAVMLRVPAAVSVTVVVARPLATATAVPSAAVPSKNVTVPPGKPLVLEATVAVSVIGEPRMIDATLEVTELTVPALVIVTEPVVEVSV